jgi:hypothetical protein
MDKKSQAVEAARALIFSEGFKRRHSMTGKAFTRTRCLTFALVLVLNELTLWLAEPPVTASAFTQARYKLKHQGPSSR